MGGATSGLRASGGPGPAGLRHAVAGVRVVFLLTAPAAPAPDHDLAMPAAARTAGVASVVKLSAIGTGGSGVRCRPDVPGYTWRALPAGESPTITANSGEGVT